MLLYRIGPQGAYAAAEQGGEPRALLSDPYATPPASWELGQPVPLGGDGLPRGVLAPVAPGKIVGIGRNYRDHAAELGNPMPAEPVIFLKAPSSVIGPGAAVVLPAASRQVEYEGEIALVVGRRIHRASRRQAAAAVFGVTAACDVTARDLQRRDPTFARGKSFDTFCPLGPAIRVGADLEDLEVVTRVDGAERQRGHARQMAWGLVELVAYASGIMTLEPGDVLLTGTPAGVGTLAAGNRLEVEVSGVGTLVLRVEAEAPAVTDDPVAAGLREGAG
ncbi:MAG TPA: fumarylacetoacetate hydrolase family protein [Thermoanaerobaculia bacterium]|nr:fumarylacetoacetate hydrolase family protein [Thermoanaerobaculia bacterium]